MSFVEFAQHVTEMSFPDGAVVGEGDKAILHAIIQEQPLPHRLALQMRYVLNMEYRDMGTEMGVSHTTAFNRTKVAVSKVKDNLLHFAQVVAIAKRTINNTPKPAEAEPTEPRPHTLSVRVSTPLYQRIEQYRQSLTGDVSLSKACEALLSVGLAHDA